MTKWIKFNLKRGKTESGVQLLDAKLMEDIHRVTTAMPSALPLVKPKFPISDITLGYGYGWEVSEYRGINRGSYMSAHVLLNLLNELRKRDKMRGLPSISSLFRNEFNTFDTTKARI